MLNRVFLLLIVLCATSLFAAEDYFFKANELYDQGKFKEAVPLYRAAIDEGRYEPFAWFNLGNAMGTLAHFRKGLDAHGRPLLPEW